jgi:hypothetical protein
MRRELHAVAEHGIAYDIFTTFLTSRSSKAKRSELAANERNIGI